MVDPDVTLPLPTPNLTLADYPVQPMPSISSVRYTAPHAASHRSADVIRMEGLREPILSTNP